MIEKSQDNRLRKLALAGELALIAIALAKFGLHLAMAGRYGYFVDEFYTVAMGKHIAGGFVDVPPLAPILTGAWTALFGVSLFSIRFLAALIGAATVYMAGRIAREMGCKASGQVLVASAVLFAPVFLSFNSFLAYDGFDQLLCSFFFFFSVRLLKGGDRRLWVAIGIAGGTALMAKYTMLFIGLAFVIGVLMSGRRKDYLTRWPWLGALAAVAIVSPWAAWQALHGWPVIEYWRAYAQVRTYAASVSEFAVMQLLGYGIIAIPLWLAGIVWLLAAKPAKPFRAIGFTALAAYAILFLTHAKFYMSASLYPALFSGGAMAFQAWAEKGKRRFAAPVAAAIIALGGIVVLPSSVPLLGIKGTLKYLKYSRIFWDNIRLDNSPEPSLPFIFSARFGWEEIAQAVARTYDRLPGTEKGDCVILCGSYGYAGAIDLLGKKYGLPPAASGHLSYWLWGYGEKSGNTIIAVGYSPSALYSLFKEVERVDQAAYAPNALSYNQNAVVYLCRGPIRPFKELWKGNLKHFD
jgi:hypothetical protein